MTLLLGLLTAHLLVDYVLLPIPAKRTFRHTWQHGLVMSLLTAGFLVIAHYQVSLTVQQVVALSAGIGAAYILLDWALLWLGGIHSLAQQETRLLMLDQLLHIATLTSAFRYISMTQLAPATTFRLIGTQLDKYLLIVMLVLLGVNAPAVFIGRMLEPFRKHMNAEKSLTPNAGLWIGICERLLIIVAIAAGADIFPTVGLIMTAKSVFRFRELERKANAEYYLLGSLLSICAAVVAGLLLRMVVE